MNAPSNVAITPIQSLRETVRSEANEAGREDVTDEGVALVLDMIRV
jgi:hypothetical protein